MRLDGLGALCTFERFGAYRQGYCCLSYYAGKDGIDSSGMIDGDGDIHHVKVMFARAEIKAIIDCHVVRS